jgi:hypothetical protein
MDKASHVKPTSPQFICGHALPKTNNAGCSGTIQSGSPPGVSAATPLLNPGSWILAP